MNKQPNNEVMTEALRLADDLDAYHTRSIHREAAAELRRLHEVNQELLAALKWVAEYVDAAPNELTEAKKWLEIAKHLIYKTGSKNAT